MKIKCVRHQRRVVVTETGEMIHRTGDGSWCKGFHLYDTDRIIDETNGAKRHARYDRVLASDLVNDFCKFCGADRSDYHWAQYQAEEGMPLFKSSASLYCPDRQGIQSHVFG